MVTGLTRVAVAALQPGDEARPTRTSSPYTVASVTAQHGAWAVTGTDRVTRHYAATARLWRTALCAGQTAIVGLAAVPPPLAAAVLAPLIAGAADA